MGMLLNNDTLQVNFIDDSVKIVVHSPFITSTSVVILISPTRNLEVSCMPRFSVLCNCYVVNKLC